MMPGIRSSTLKHLLNGSVTLKMNELNKILQKRLPKFGTMKEKECWRGR